MSCLYSQFEQFTRFLLLSYRTIGGNCIPRGVPNKYLSPSPKNHPKTPFWPIFRCKPIVERALSVSPA